MGAPTIRTAVEGQLEEPQFQPDLDGDLPGDRPDQPDGRAMPPDGPTRQDRPKIGRRTGHRIVIATA